MWWHQLAARSVHGLYDNFTTLLFCEQEVATSLVTSGRTQGCPLGGTLFALALDPLVRRFLAHSVLSSVRFTVFADDMALAIECLRKQLGCASLRSGRRGWG